MEFLTDAQIIAPQATGRENRNDLPTAFKRLIICCDGTWQSSTTAKPNIPSNVTQISRSLAPSSHAKDGKTWQQIVYYDAGVGTGSISISEKGHQGATGRGLDINVIEAYNFLVNNYVHGDEIFFFGFSRGAFTVRAIAGLVCRIGVLKPAEMRYFPMLYDRYKSAEYDMTSASVDEWWTRKFSDHAYKRPRDDVPVKVIGVWDTVAALGLPIIGSIDNSKSRQKYLYHKVDIHPRMEYVFQALALDERRSPFTPLVMSVPPENQSTILVQVWFPGLHINVGGGDMDGLNARYRGDHENLAHISLAWMVDRVSPFLDFDHETLLFNLQMKDSSRGSRAGMVSKVKYASGAFKYSSISRFLGRKDRTPGEYIASNLGRCNEYIHPSVFVRQVGVASHGRGYSTNALKPDLTSKKKPKDHLPKSESSKKLVNPSQRTSQTNDPRILKSVATQTRLSIFQGSQKLRLIANLGEPSRNDTYVPRGLDEFIRTPNTDGTVGYGWRRAGTISTYLCHRRETIPPITIPEFIIPPRTDGSVPSMERLLIREQPWAHELLREMDAQNGIDHAVLEENEEGEREELVRARKWTRWSCKTMAY